jgi:hypothetical protein
MEDGEGLNVLPRPGTVAADPVARNFRNPVFDAGCAAAALRE